MKNTFSDIISLLNQNERARFYVLTLLNIFISLLDIFCLAALVFIVSFYTQQKNTIGFPFAQSGLPTNKSISLILYFLLFYFVKNIAAYLVSGGQYRFVYNLASRISKQTLANHLDGEYTAHINIDSSVHIRNISQEPIEFAHYILAGSQLIITETALILFSVTTIVLYSPRLFFCVSGLLLPMVLLTWLYTRAQIHNRRNGIKTKSAEALQYLKEALAGFVESNVYGKNAFFTNRYAKSQQALNKHLAGLQKIQALPARFLELFAIAGLFALILANNTWGGPNTNNLVLIGAFMAATYKIIPGMVRIINAGSQIKAYQFVLPDIRKLIELPVVKRPGFSNSYIHSISFQNVSFNYNNRQILTNFNWHIKGGEFVGITGMSGRGKTTIINLLLGLIKEGHGKIYINNKERSAADRSKYWPKTAYVKQQNFLIHDTVQKNIVIDDVEIDDDKLERVLEIAGLSSLLHQATDKQRKIISEDGKNISGGQRQRIAIARALLKDAGLFILDEPFNELDYNSELSLLQHFKSLSRQGKIVILITHNQKSLAFCDKIICLDD